MQADSDGIINRVGNRGNRRGERTLAAFLRAERSFGINALDDNWFDFWRFYRRRTTVFEHAGIHQHAVFPDHFFGERLSHTHPDSADDLTFHAPTNRRLRLCGAGALARETFPEVISAED